MFSEVDAGGFRFSDVTRSEYSETYVGFSDKHIIKIEQAKCGQKVNDLQREIDIIRYLNEHECVSCPQLFSDGFLESGQRYLIQERIRPAREFNYADMVFSMIEQKRLGVSQADFRRQNLIFDENGICYIVDYDQARVNNKFISMSNREYLDIFTAFFATCGYEKAKFDCLFHDGAFSLAETTIMKRQVTTHTDMGIYHSIYTPDIFINGIRSLGPRVASLDRVEFKKGETVLDIGCNMGLLGHYLTDRGCVVTGVDMDLPITRAAKMVANIVGKNIRFYSFDTDNGLITDSFDTVCLFSVLHHAKDYVAAAKNIAKCCNRIIIESKLYEVGSKFVDGKWIPGGSWNVNTLQGLIVHFEKLFPGFVFDKYYGVGDRDRHILSLLKSHV